VKHDRWDKRPYLQRVGDALSQFANAVLANGMPDESLSGRSYRNTRLVTEPKLRWRIVAFLAEVLFYPIDKGQHCEAAFWQDIDRAGVRWRAAKGNTSLAETLDGTTEAA
jgi:hypothetical protein